MFHFHSISIKGKNITESHVCLSQSLFLADRSTLADDSQITALATERKGKWKCIGVKGKVFRFQSSRFLCEVQHHQSTSSFLQKLMFFCEKCQFAVFARDNAGKIDSLYCVLWITKRHNIVKLHFLANNLRKPIAGPILPNPCPWNVAVLAYFTIKSCEM